MPTWMSVNLAATLRVYLGFLAGILLLVCAGATSAVAAVSSTDWDGDGVLNSADNCTKLANPSQLDADHDGYGNLCDADLNSSGQTDTGDYVIMRSVLNQTAQSSALAAAADMDGNGVVNTADWSRLRAALSQPPGPSGVATANRAPVISGSPSRTVVAGSPYIFTPTAADPDGQALTFRVTGAPAWATFSSATGTLRGTPTLSNVGQVQGIVISVSDGANSASLPAFSLAVVQVASGAATVSWLPPLQRTDGSALTNLAGYRILFGTSPSLLNHTIEVRNPGLTTYMVGSLPPGTWYFGLVAFDSAGTTSALSAIRTKKIT